MGVRNKRVRKREESVKFISFLENKPIYYSTALRCGSFSEKNIEKKTLVPHEKIYYYFYISNITANNLIVLEI